MTRQVIVSIMFHTDLNGVELILDADADTSITADTDDRIDFKLQIQITYNLVLQVVILQLK